MVLFGRKLSCKPLPNIPFQSALGELEREEKRQQRGGLNQDIDSIRILVKLMAH